MSKHNPLIRRTIGMLAAAALISGTMSALHGALPRSQAAPVLAPETPAQTAAPVAGEKDLETDRTAERRGGVFTLILAGLDEVSGNTDTILVGRVDAQARRMDFVSIPRDTYVNLPWEVRKINCVYTGTINSGGSGLEGLRGSVRSLTGFDADCCAVVDIGTVKEAIDLMGGVYFDVPFDMDYEDAEQDLYIHIPAGYRCLSGEECVQLCRYRKDYVNGDLDRITLQHSFLSAAAKQFISLGSIPNLARVVQLLSSGMDSDVTASNIAFLMRCAIQCRAEDIGFYTMPNIPADVDGLSYTFVEPEAWLELLNETLNPFDAPLREENLDLVYWRGGALRSTLGVIRGKTEQGA